MRMIDMFKEMENKDQQQQPMMKGGATPEPVAAPLSLTGPDARMAEFISGTLADVLTTTQMRGIVQTGDPKFIDPPMTDTQRTVVTEKVMRSVLSPEQIQQFSENGAVAMESLTPVQKNIIADLSTGHAAGRVLNLGQFRSFSQATGPTIMSPEQALLLRPFTRVEGDPSPPVYNSMRTAASPHYMQLGRYMDRPATDFVKEPTGGGLLAGGANACLSILKEQISSIPY